FPGLQSARSVADRGARSGGGAGYNPQRWSGVRFSGGVAELVDAADLKFADASRTGSSPVTATTGAADNCREHRRPPPKSLHFPGYSRRCPPIASVDSIAPLGVKTRGNSHFGGNRGNFRVEPVPWGNRTRMALTDTEIKSARAAEKPYKLFDERGLYLLVNPNGSRWWRLKYRYEGKEKLLSLGV